MHIISILLFAFSSNMDNFIVSTSYGIKKIKINFNANLTIGMITFIGTVLSMLIGKGLLKYLSSAIANILGSLILFMIGCIYLFKYLYQKIKKSHSIPLYCDNLEKYDKNKSANIEFKESLTLGLALTINNIGLGIGASISGLNVIITSLISLSFSLTFIFIGNSLGNSWFSKYLGKYAEPIASIIIILLGLLGIFLE